MKINHDVIEAIGNTPLIKLKRASELTGCTILGKAEFMNPGQSVKDRAGKWMILEAEKRGELRTGGLVVEATAALTIGAYLLSLYVSDRWTQTWTAPGVAYSALTGICVGVGTILFFLLFQKGGPLSAVPAILAVGAALMAAAGIVGFGERPTPARLIGIALSLAGLYLVR